LKERMPLFISDY